MAMPTTNQNHPTSRHSLTHLRHPFHLEFAEFASRLFFVDEKMPIGG
jgi:hypothetical protein